MAEQCNCIFTENYGRVHICDFHKQESWNRYHPHRKGHTRKTNGIAAKNRQRRCVLRGLLWSEDKNQSHLSELISLTSKEYEKANPAYYK